MPTEQKTYNRNKKPQTNRLFIGGIDATVKKEDLFQYFSKFGKIDKTEVICNKHTGMSKGYGFVRFFDEASFQAVLSKSHKINQRTIDVNYAAQKWETTSLKKEIYDKKLFINGITDEIDSDSLKNYFSRFGTVTKAYVILDPISGGKKSFGFVEFKDKKSAKKALSVSSHKVNFVKINCSHYRGKNSNKLNNNEQSPKNTTEYPKKKRILKRQNTKAFANSINHKKQTINHSSMVMSQRQEYLVPTRNLFDQFKNSQNWDNADFEIPYQHCPAPLTDNFVNCEARNELKKFQNQKFNNSGKTRKFSQQSEKKIENIELNQKDQCERVLYNSLRQQNLITSYLFQMSQKASTEYAYQYPKQNTRIPLDINNYVRFSPCGNYRFNLHSSLLKRQLKQLSPDSSSHSQYEDLHSQYY